MLVQLDSTDLIAPNIVKMARFNGNQVAQEGLKGSKTETIMKCFSHSGAFPQEPAIEFPTADIEDNDFDYEDDTNVGFNTW